MDREAVLAALRAVGAHLDRRGLQGDLYLVGGAAMAVAYDARRTTRDVDAVFEPKMAIYEAAAAVAAELGLPPDWLNDAVKGFVTRDDPYGGAVYEFPGLRVQAASPEMLLGLKVLAARVGEDDDDLAWLVRHLRLKRAQDVLELAATIVGEQRLTARSRFFVEQVMDDLGSAT